MLSLQPYNLYSPICDWGTLYYLENVFSDKMIQELDTFVQANYKFEKGRTGIVETDTHTDSYKTNNRNIAYLHPGEKTGWLYEFLFPLALEANRKLYQFDIDIVTDPVHYVVYPEDGGHLDWHMDVGAFGVNRRKIAMTVQLSDSSEYDGGDFQIWSGGTENFVTVSRKKGDVIMFPTFLMHRVTPITRGQRKCLVFWVGGRPFK